MEIANGKILEFSEKGHEDTKQLLSKINREQYDTYIGFLKSDEERRNYIDNLHFKKGNTVWLELKIEDSYLSSELMSWLYSKSNFDNGPLHVMGASLQSIMFSKPSGYTSEEIAAVKTLYEKMVGTVNNL